MKKYYYKLILKYLNFYTFKNDKLLEIEPITFNLKEELKKEVLYKSISQKAIFQNSKILDTDFVLLNGTIHYIKNIYNFLTNLNKITAPRTRLIFITYSTLWKPLILISKFFGVKYNNIFQNWISPEDFKNFIYITNYEILHSEKKIIIPFYIPLISNFINRFIAPLNFFKHLCLINIYIVKTKNYSKKENTVSVIVPARNEEGNIENIVKQIPKIGKKTEVIFVEGNSKDKTWEEIQKVTKKYSNKNITYSCYKQTGIGKGDAVRLGFSKAKNEILMILDADLTVGANELNYFYELIISGKGEFINGSRLVYEMEKGAMRFFNLLGNFFFAKSFSFTLGQTFKDTLCGTKVITKSNYLKIAKNREYFGKIDPFGDFDLLFGAARMNLKITEYPISYKERVYGTTNISRWKHGFILLRMLVKAALKIKFI